MKAAKDGDLKKRSENLGRENIQEMLRSEPKRYLDSTQIIYGKNI